MERWQKILRENLLSPGEIARLSGLSPEQLTAIQNRFPVRVRAAMLQGDASGAIARQFLPDARELEPGGVEDPLAEEHHRKSALIIHRYPNRALFLVSNVCASYCRFCTRRRLVGRPPFPTRTQIEEGLAYVRATPSLSEIILSGGDPLLLEDKKLQSILERLREIPHVRIIRVATRTFLALPERFTNGLVELLSRHQPLYLITQFNHPDEFGPGVDAALEKVTGRGIPVLNQSVLLRGINDHPETMLRLVQMMAERRVRPYYLHQLDPVRGALHFQVPIERGKAIIDYLRRNIGGYAVPTFVYDDPSAPAKTLLYP